MLKNYLKQAIQSHAFTSDVLVTLLKEELWRIYCANSDTNNDYIPFIMIFFHNKIVWQSNEIFNTIRKLLIL